MLAYIAGENGRIIPSRELEENIQFPQQSIFNAARKLKKAGFINTVAGPFGGYTLGKPPKNISIQDVLALFNDTFSICRRKEPDGTATLKNFVKRVKDIEDDFVQEMSRTTLADLLPAK